MPSLPPPPAPFASLVPERQPRGRWSIAQLFSAPFRDVDARVALKAAAAKAEREAAQREAAQTAPREAASRETAPREIAPLEIAMSGAEPRRR